VKSDYTANKIIRREYGRTKRGMEREANRQPKQSESGQNEDKREQIASSNMHIGQKAGRKWAEAVFSD
jgi:hypothetical protein